MIRLKALAETCRFDRSQPVMHVVQQMNFVAKLDAKRFEQLGM